MSETAKPDLTEAYALLETLSIKFVEAQKSYMDSVTVRVRGERFEAMLQAERDRNKVADAIANVMACSPFPSYQLTRAVVQREIDKFTAQAGGNPDA